MIVVTLKYVVLILRADNRGEGGIMALNRAGGQGRGAHAQAPQHPAAHRRAGCRSLLRRQRHHAGDLRARRHRRPRGPSRRRSSPTCCRSRWPSSSASSSASASARRRWAKLFGPVIVVWFVVLAVTGAVQIAHHPAILSALNPLRAFEFLQMRGWRLFIVMGSIVLALTGAEALYADMGHFGKTPIRLAWNTFVLPSLAINYMGPGRVAHHRPGCAREPVLPPLPDLPAGARP